MVGADILDDEGKALAERLTAAGPGAMEYWHLDVSSADQWAALAAHLAARPSSTVLPAGQQRGHALPGAARGPWTWRAGSG